VNSADPTYCMLMVPPNFLMHAISCAWWGGLWLSEQAFADTVQKVLLCLMVASLSWASPSHLLEELKRMSTLEFNCGNLGALDGQDVDHWWAFRTSYFELKQSNVPCYASMRSDWPGGLLHAHMKFNYRHHRLQLEVLLCCNVMHFQQVKSGSLVFLGTSGVKVQRFLTFLREVTATFVYFGVNL
jgi:hypothetical protein